jgi:hypothetical protein
MEATILLDATALNEYYFVNLRAPLIVENAGQREFSGIVIESFPVDSKIIALSCRSTMQHLRELTITFASFQNFTPQEMLYYLVKQTSDIDASENSIHGLSLNKQERDFLIASPVRSLSIKNTITLSGVTLSRLEPTSEDSRLMIVKGKWIEGTAIASIIIRSTGFIEAWTIGREKIAGLIDAVSYGATLSTLGYRSSGGTFNAFDWLRSNTLSRISLQQDTYLRDLSTNPPKIWIRAEPTREHNLELIDAKSIVVQTSNPILQASNSLGALGTGVRWLRLGTQETDMTDRLLDYWVSFEFLVSNEKRATFLSTNGVEDIQSAITGATIRKTDGSVMTGDELRKLSARVISRVNNIDLRERFDSFMSNKGQAFTISDSEYECIWGRGGLRDQRNDLEHGRSVHVDEAALGIMKHVLDKMVLAVIQVQ